MSDRRRPGDPGAYCVICGNGPFIQVGHHVRQKHRMTPKEYRRRFPGVLMTDPSFIEWFADNARCNGSGPGMKKRQRECKRGHALRGKNVRWAKGRRWCRVCDRERSRARRSTCVSCGRSCSIRAQRCDQCAKDLLRTPAMRERARQYVKRRGKKQLQVAE